MNVSYESKLVKVGLAQIKLKAPDAEYADREEDPKKCAECGVSFHDTFQLRIHIMKQHWPSYTFSGDSLIQPDYDESGEGRGTLKERDDGMNMSEDDDETTVRDPLAILPGDLVETKKGLSVVDKVLSPRAKKCGDCDNRKQESLLLKRKANDVRKKQENAPSKDSNSFGGNDTLHSSYATTVTCAQCKVSISAKELTISGGLAMCSECAFKLTCPYCKVKFTSLDRVKAHKETWHLCKICKKLFGDLHMHTTMQMTCIICHVPMCNKKDLLNHYLTRHGKCWCANCNLMFKDELDLYVHSRMKH